jgi:hypothetical protein
VSPRADPVGHADHRQVGRRQPEEEEDNPVPDSPQAFHERGVRAAREGRLKPEILAACRKFIDSIQEQTACPAVLVSGANGDNPAAISSAFRNFRQFANTGRNLAANVAFPARFGPAMT